MSKNTPGPWDVFHVDGSWPGIDAGENAIIRYGDIAFGEDCGVRGPTEEEAIANARLIAAAPDLLAVLRDVRTFYAEVLNDTPADRAIAARIDAAIAKAEGAA